MINGDDGDDDDDVGDMMMYATIFRRTMRRNVFRVKIVIRVLVLRFFFTLFAQRLLVSSEINCSRGFKNKLAVAVGLMQRVSPDGF